jgi:hypothetical protein
MRREGTSPEAVLRLFRFRPVDPAFDRILRDTMIPDLVTCRGLLEVFAGRQGPDQTGERIVASVWESRQSMVDAVGSDFDAPRFHPEHFHDTTEKRLDVLPIAFAFAPSPAAPQALLRLVTGRARANRLGAYVERVAGGTTADAAAGRGPLALYLGAGEGDAFATLSAWGQWSKVAEATGGSILRPVTTRHQELLAEWTASHYEAVLLDRATASVSADAF